MLSRFVGCIVVNDRIMILGYGIWLCSHAKQAGGVVIRPCAVYGRCNRLAGLAGAGQEHGRDTRGVGGGLSSMKP